MLVLENKVMNLETKVMNLETDALTAHHNALYDEWRLTELEKTVRRQKVRLQDFDTQSRSATLTKLATVKDPGKGKVGKVGKVGNGKGKGTGKVGKDKDNGKGKGHQPSAVVLAIKDTGKGARKSEDDDYTDIDAFMDETDSLCGCGSSTNSNSSSYHGQIADNIPPMFVNRQR